MSSGNVPSGQENQPSTSLPVRTKPSKQPPMDANPEEKISKNEQKRRQKEQEREERKAAKAAIIPHQADKKGSAEADLTPNVGYSPFIQQISRVLILIFATQQYTEIRSRVVKELRRTPHFDVLGANPPHNDTVNEFIPKYEHIKTGEHLKDVKVSLAGRVFAKRESSSKLLFYDLRDEGGELQIMCQAQEVRISPAYYLKA